MNKLNQLLLMNMKDARQKLRYSQMRLAEICNISTSFIAEIETGKKFPSSSTLLRISEALGLKPYQLFMEKVEENQELNPTKRFNLLTKLYRELKDELDKDLEKIIKKYCTSDLHVTNTAVKGSFRWKDLEPFKRALEKVRIQDRFAYCYLEEGCAQKLLSIIGDFFLSLEEIDFVFLCARDDNTITFYVGSKEETRWNANTIMREILRGVGFGGGSHSTAVGIIKDRELFNEEEFFIKLSGILKEI